MLQFDIDNRWPHAPMQKAPVAPPGFSLRAGFFIDHMGAASVGGLFHFETSVHRRQWIIKRYSARRLFTFSWGLTWQNVNCGLGRRKILPSLRLIQKPERRSQRFRK